MSKKSIIGKSSEVIAVSVLMSLEKGGGYAGSH
jgi:hypothetical protein